MIVVHIPKHARYTLGAKIEELFLTVLERTYAAYYSERERRASMLSDCIISLDTLKCLVSVAWEGKYISHAQAQYEQLALTLHEIGKMLGGWRKSFENPEKKNRLA